MSNFKQTLTRYTSFLRWLLLDSLWRRKGLSLLILATGFFGVAFQVQVFGVIIYYAQHFSSGKEISLLGYSFDPRSSVGLLGLGSAAVIMLLLLSAFCIYFSRRSILRMGREYEEFCSKRVYYLLGQHADIFPCITSGVDPDSYLFRLIKTDSRFAGRVLRMLLTLINPGLTLAVAGAVLIYLEPFLTLLIAVLSGVFAYYQIRISNSAAGYSMRFEKLAPAAGQKYKSLLHYCKQQAGQDKRQDLVQAMFARGPVKKQLDSYEGRLQAVEKSRLVSGIFMAVILGLILLVMGAAIIHEGQGWGRLVIYVGALRFAMTNLQNSFSTITSINRFYPQVRRYSLFVRSFKDQDREQFPVLDEYKLQVDTQTGTDMLKGSLETVEVKPGRRISLATPSELNRYTMASMARAMLGEDEKAFKGALYSMRFATRKQSCPGMSLRRILELGPDAKWPDMQAWFPDQETFELARKQLPRSLDKQITPKIWDQVDPKLKFILSLISARQSDCQWILLEAKGLNSLGKEAAEFYLTLFRDRIMVITFNQNLDQVGAFDEDIVTVMDEERLVGLGSPDWFASVRAQAEGVFDSSRAGTAGKNAESGVQEEDEEEV